MARKSADPLERRIEPLGDHTWPFQQMLIHTDIRRRITGYCAGEATEAFIQICQEGRIMRTLIGVFHSGAEQHGRQLCFHVWARSSAAASARSCFSFLTCLISEAVAGYEDIAVVAFRIGSLCRLAACLPTNPLPEELCHALLRGVCRREGGRGG